MDENRPEVINDVRPGRNNYFKLQIIQFAGKRNRNFAREPAHYAFFMRAEPCAISRDVSRRRWVWFKAT
jgi:hypothetical protein